MGDKASKPTRISDSSGTAKMGPLKSSKAQRTVKNMPQVTNMATSHIRKQGGGADRISDDSTI